MTASSPKELSKRLPRATAEDWEPETPTRARLAYIGDMLRSLKGLAEGHELGLLRYLIAMAIEETEDQLRVSRRAEADSPAGPRDG